MTEEEGAQDRAKALQKLFIFLVFAVVAIFLGFFTPVGQYCSTDTIREVVENLGFWGPVAIVVIGIVTPLLFLPRWPIAFVSGLLYGVVWGALLATVTSTLGAVLHYWLAKGLLAPSAEQALKKFRMSRESVPKDKMFLLFFLLRTFPLSNFILTNLLAGALRVELRVYVLASLLGMLPSSVMYASWGKLMKKPSASFYLVAALSMVFVVVGVLLAQKRFYPWLKGLRGGGEEGNSSKV